MDGEIKERKERAKKPEIKIALSDFQDLETYGKVVGKSPVKIVNELIKEFLAREDVKQAVEENGEYAKAQERIRKRVEKIAKMQEENEADRKKYGIK